MWIDDNDADAEGFIITVQDVYDAVVGSGSKDVYLEGMDKDFMEWRLRHGAEWARYYNLRVIVLLKLQCNQCSPKLFLSNGNVQSTMPY